jgi:hypothetical protein
LAGRNAAVDGGATEGVGAGAAAGPVASAHNHEAAQVAAVVHEAAQERFWQRLSCARKYRTQSYFKQQ